MEKLKLITAHVNAKDIPIDYERLCRRITKQNDSDTLNEAFSDCLAECEKSIQPKACYMYLPVTCNNDRIDLDVFSLKSSRLAKLLDDCRFCVAMGATIGLGIDRVIAKYSALSPLKAWICQMIGEAYVEAWCDLLCNNIKAETGLFLKPRFSPGYGDLPLSEQEKLFGLLDLSRQCGITLTESLIMRPSKSVTAFVGISDKPYCTVSKCSLCNKLDCEYRND